MAAGQIMKIYIKGTQRTPDLPKEAEEVFETVQHVEAEYFRKGDSHYLFYEEQPEGFPKPLKTRIKLKGQTLEIYRQGPGGNTMFWAPGQRYRTEYVTPYGALLLDIVTESFLTDAVQDTETWPSVTVEYILENEGEILSCNRLEIGRE